MSENNPNAAEQPAKPEILPYLTPATFQNANRNAGRWLRVVIFTVGGVVAVLFLIALLLPSLCSSSERANRVKCASNLRQIGQGLQLYANDYRSYPRTRYDPTRPIGNGFTGVGLADSFGGNTPAIPGPAANDPTAALFLLVKLTDLNPEVFVCPSSSQEKDTFTVKRVTYTFKTTSNFTSANNLSYSFANMYPGTAAVNAGYLWSPDVTSDFAIAADRNDADPKAFTGIKSGAPQAQQRLMNSWNHEQEGQNILYNDGHVEWTTSPWAGANMDNIYTSAKVDSVGKQLTPAESDGQWPEPQGALDTVLVPRKGSGF